MDEIKKAKEISAILIKKLTKEELHDLLTIYDNGNFDEYAVNYLFERDKLNYPKEYLYFGFCRR